MPHDLRLPEKDARMNFLSILSTRKCAAALACLLGLQLTSCGGGASSGSGNTTNTGAGSSPGPSLVLAVNPQATQLTRIAMSDPGSALYKVALSILPGSANAGVTGLSVSSTALAPAVLSDYAINNGVRIVSPTYVIASIGATGAARSQPMQARQASLTLNQAANLPYMVELPLPANLGTDIPSVRFYNPTTGAFESVQIIAVDQANGIISFATSYTGQFVVTATKAAAAIDVGFRVGVDDFAIANIATPDNPGGVCLGYAAFAQWFFQNRGSLGISLRDYTGNGTPSNPYDDERAFNMADLAHSIINQHSSAILAMAAKLDYWGKNRPDFYDASMVFGRIGNLFNQWANQNLEFQGYSVADQTIASLLAERRPVLWALEYRDSKKQLHAHAVLAYRYENNKFYLSDPNHPAGTCTEKSCTSLAPITIDYNRTNGTFSQPSIDLMSNEPVNIMSDTWQMVGIGVIDATMLWDSLNPVSLPGGKVVASMADILSAADLIASGTDNYYQSRFGNILLDNIALKRSNQNAQTVLCLADDNQVCPVTGLSSVRGSLLDVRDISMVYSPSNLPHPAGMADAGGSYPEIYRLLGGAVSGDAGDFRLPMNSAIAPKPITLQAYTPAQPDGALLLNSYRTMNVVPAHLDLDFGDLNASATSRDPLADAGAALVIDKVYPVLTSGRRVLADSRASAEYDGYYAVSDMTLTNRISGVQTGLVAGESVLFAIGGSYTLTVRGGMTSSKAIVAGRPVSIWTQDAITSFDLDLPLSYRVSMPAIIASGAHCGLVPSSTLNGSIVHDGTQWLLQLNGIYHVAPLIFDGKMHVISAPSPTLPINDISLQINADGSLQGQVRYLTSDGCSGTQPFQPGSKIISGAPVRSNYKYKVYGI
jgi:hypothetical protein